MYEIIMGSMLMGKRRILKRESAVKAVAASSIPPVSTYVTNVARVTWVSTKHDQTIEINCVAVQI